MDFNVHITIVLVIYWLALYDKSSSRRFTKRSINIKFAIHFTASGASTLFYIFFLFIYFIKNTNYLSDVTLKIINLFNRRYFYNKSYNNTIYLLNYILINY